MSTTGKVLIGTGVVLVTGGVLLPVLGFGSSGIIIASKAAAIQSGIGNVAAGSTFATI